MQIRTLAARIAIVCALLAPIGFIRADDKPAAAKPAHRLPKGIKAERDIIYVEGGGRDQALDLYLPDTPTEKPMPLVIWIHGGGWQAGTKAGAPGVQMVNRGYAVASIEYRFSQKALFPAQIQDCKAAIRWLRGHADKYNFDVKHIGVWGGSAGGHLVALLDVTGDSKAFPPIGQYLEQSDAVQCVVDLFGPTDFVHVAEQAATTHSVFNFNNGSDPYSNLIGGPVTDPANHDKDVAVSPMTYVSKSAAPLLILHGSVDRLVPYAQSVEFADALQKAGAEVLLQKLPGADHGGPAFMQPKIIELVAKFFDKHLMGKDAKIEVLPDEEVTLPVKTGE